MATPPHKLMPVYAAPGSALLTESADAETLRAMKAKLRRLAWQGGLVALSCGMGGVGVLGGYFDGEGAAAVASTDPVKIMVVGAMVVGGISGLLGTAVALLGSSMVAHWIDHALEDEGAAQTPR